MLFPAGAQRLYSPFPREWRAQQLRAVHQERVTLLLGQVHHRDSAGELSGNPAHSRAPCAIEGAGAVSIYLWEAAAPVIRLSRDAGRNSQGHAGTCAFTPLQLWPPVRHAPCSTLSPGIRGGEEGKTLKKETCTTRKPRKVRRVQSAEVTGSPNLQLSFSISAKRHHSEPPEFCLWHWRAQDSAYCIDMRR